MPPAARRDTFEFLRHDRRRSQAMSWFRVTAGRLEYRGRIAREPFTRWTAPKDGGAAVARVARAVRCSLIGRSRSARRRIWRALDAATRVRRST